MNKSIIIFLLGLILQLPIFGKTVKTDESKTQTPSSTVDFSLFCVDSVWYDTLNPIFINVRIYNGNTDQINYPSVQIVSPTLDTISNTFNLVNYFAHLGNIFLTYQDTISVLGIQDFSNYSFLLSENFGDTTVQINFCQTTGIENVSSDEIIIYPNPTENNFTINNASSVNDIYMFLFDHDDRLIKHEKIDGQNTSIDISQLGPGVYFVKMQSKEFVKFSRIIKQ